MSSAPEEFSNIQINDEIENKPIFKMDNIKDDSISISVNSQITNDNSQNTSNRTTRKNKINEIQHSLTSTLLLSNKKTLYIENEFFPEKEDSAFDLLFFKNKNENEEITENKKDEKNMENKIEVKENKIEIKEEEIKINVNNIQINNVNKNTCLNNYENCNVNKSVEKNINKKIDKNDNYSQTYSRNDFSDRPPKVSKLFIHNYNYENKNIFSHSNNICGNIKESKKIPNIFYNHLLINNENNGRYITTSLNKNNNGKLTTFIFYTA